MKLLEERKPTITETMRRETGFTTCDVHDEFARALVTLSLCAQEASRLSGEVVPLDASPGFEQRLAFTIGIPIGVVLAITRFNAPLNTVCHKIGPALAAGNAVILKRAEYTPLTAQALVHVLRDAGLPEGYPQVLYGSGTQATTEAPHAGHHSRSGARLRRRVGPAGVPPRRRPDTMDIA